jgi:5'-nucleotidase
MLQPITPIELLTGFQYQDAPDVLHKLAAFAAAGPQNLHVVSDFDLTLTAGKERGQNLGTWDVMDELMPPEGIARHAAIYNSFRPIELLGQLTDTVAAEKWSETLDLIVGYHMDINTVESAFLSVAKLREGGKELFDICEQSGIPTVVLSSGIRNVIEQMAMHYGIHPTHILSNDLVVDDAGTVQAWRRDTLIHMLNKKEMGHSELSKLRTTRPNVLLMGDVPDDAKMVAGDNVIRIRVIDPRKGETHSRDILERSFAAGYDLVIEHSLRPVSSIVHWLVDRAHGTAHA